MSKTNITIYHNPRCSKSRQALQYLKEKGVKPVVREYLKDQLIKHEIVELLNMLGNDAKNILRTKESVYQEKYKERKLIGKEIADAIVTDPILMERPLVQRGGEAIIARPVERIDEVL